MPHSRFVRLALAEYGIKPELIEEKPFERRRDFLILDPAGQTPVLVTDPECRFRAPGPSPNISTRRAASPGKHRLLPHDPGPRVEVRRLVDWFGQKFFGEVTNWLVTEKVYKRFMPRERAAARRTWTSCAPRAPISAPICAISAIWRRTGIGWPATGCPMPILPPRRIFPVADFLGDVPWDENEDGEALVRADEIAPGLPLAARRPAAGHLSPNPVYADLDF